LLQRRRGPGQGRRDHAKGQQDQQQQAIDAEREAEAGQAAAERRSIAFGREPVGRQGEGDSSGKLLASNAALTAPDVNSE